MNLIMDGEIIRSENNLTSVEGIFITGTMRTGVKELLNSGSNGFKVGKQVSEYLNSIIRHMEAKKWNINFTVMVKFSPRIYIIDSVKLAKVFKLAIHSNSKNFFTPLYSINY